MCVVCVVGGGGMCVYCVVCVGGDVCVLWAHDI